MTCGNTTVVHQQMMWPNSFKIFAISHISLVATNISIENNKIKKKVNFNKPNFDLKILMNLPLKHFF